jgi:hypothetical protein
MNLTLCGLVEQTEVAALGIRMLFIAGYEQERVLVAICKHPEGGCLPLIHL